MFYRRSLTIKQRERTDEWKCQITAEMCKDVSHPQEVTCIDIKRLSSYTHEYDNCFTVSYNKVIIAIEENINSFI